MAAAATAGALSQPLGKRRFVEVAATKLAEKTDGKSRSLLIKILTLLLVNALFVLVLGFYSLYTLTAVKAMVEGALDHSLPLIKVGDFIELERAGQQRLAHVGNADAAQRAQFLQHGERLQTFLKTLVWGSDTAAFAQLESGRFAKVWRELGYDQSLHIGKSWEKIAQSASETDVLYSRYQEAAQQCWTAPSAENLDRFQLLGQKLDDSLATLRKTVDAEVDLAITSLKARQQHVSIVLVVFILVSFVLSFAVGIWFATTQLLKPIKDLSLHMQKVADGNLVVDTRIEEGDELNDLQNAFKKMVQQVSEAQALVDQKNDQMQNGLKREIEAKDVQLVQSEKLASIGEMTAGLIHEINQPLNFLKIMAQGIRRNVSKNRYKIEELPSDMKEVENYVTRLADLVNEMRKFSRKSDRHCREAISLIDPVESVIKLTGEQMRMHQITVATELDPNTGAVLAGINRMQQVLVNLSSNARDAIEGFVVPGKGKLTFRVFQEANRGIIEVEDNGGGIPEDVQARIFDPFFTTKAAEKGTGLGMGICKRIVEDFGGSLTFRSQMGMGTTFVISFPIVGAEADNKPKQSREEALAEVSALLALSKKEGTKATASAAASAVTATPAPASLTFAASVAAELPQAAVTSITPLEKI